jgi:YjbE family integral membrane protein
LNWEFFAGFIQIFLINLALSGDNAIVIGMAAASLPERLRFKTILVGGGLAIAMRIAFTAVVTTLMKVTLISAVAGAVLFWVAWRLLKMDVSEGKPDEEKKAAKNFRQAIVIIAMADFMMSLDNVLAIAGVAHGDYTLLIIGLIVSMALIMAAGGVIARLIDKFKWLPFLGSAIICYTAMRMILEDSFISEKIQNISPYVTVISIVVGLLTTTVIFMINRRKSQLTVEKISKNS